MNRRDTRAGRGRESYYETLVSIAEMRQDIPEVDLHGMDVHDAEREIDLELDRAFMAGEELVRIICGHGTGALLRAAEPFVQRHPLVKYSKVASRGGQQNAVIYAILEKK